MGMLALPTRNYLQKLTNRIDCIEAGCLVSHVPSGTGVRATSKDMAAWFKKQDRLRKLRLEKKLVEAGLLEILETGDQAEIRLTKDGCIAVLKDKILHEEGEFVNNSCCLVIFDIPEDAQSLRRSFRRFLKQAGFTQLQLSVWKTNKTISDDLVSLVKILGVEKWVCVFVGVENKSAYLS